jgi:hypothetical protein
MGRSRTTGRTRGQCFGKSNWGLPQCDGNSGTSTDLLGMRKARSKVRFKPLIKQSSPISSYMPYITAVIPLLGKKPVVGEETEMEIQQCAAFSTDVPYY